MKLNGLTAIRFFAALWVFAFHVNSRLPLGAPAPLERVLSNGALAMPIFFMLSGLVLHHRYHDKYQSFGLFLRARVARIYPAYILGITLSLPFLFSLPKVTAGTLFFLIPVDIFLMQAWYPNLWSFWHHAGTWSISVELFLYASFPLLLSIKKLQTKSILFMSFSCVVLASSYVPSFKLGASAPMPFAIYYSIPMYSLPVFILGAMLSELHRRGFKGLLIAPLLFFMALIFFGTFNTNYAGLNFVTLPLIALTLLFACNQTQDLGIFRYTINRFTLYLGDISYAFFVYQIPLLLLLDHYIVLARTLPLVVTGCGMLAINLILAAISHRWIEPWGSRIIFRLWKIQ